MRSDDMNITFEAVNLQRAEWHNYMEALSLRGRAWDEPRLVGAGWLLHECPLSHQSGPVILTHVYPEGVTICPNCGGRVAGK